MGPGQNPETRLFGLDLLVKISIPTGAVQFFFLNTPLLFFSFLSLEKRPGYPGIYHLLAAPSQVLGLQQRATKTATKTGFFVLKEVRPLHKLWELLK